VWGSKYDLRALISLLVSDLWVQPGPKS
jgi:hypothetical protein